MTHPTKCTGSVKTRWSAAPMVFRTTTLFRDVSPRLAAFAGMFLWMIGASSVQAQMVTVNPVEASGPLTNPLMGFRPSLDSYANYPYPTVIQQYIPWNAIENHESDSVQKIRDFCNAQWANLPANNVKVIPRVYIDWDWNAGNEHWPSDLTAGDWSSQRFKDRVVRLVGRLGQVWNNDPRVAWVQTGLIGYWGEQESPVGIHQDGWGQRLGDAFTAAFPNKRFVVRNMGAWPGSNAGVYWDSFGHPGQRPWAWTEIINFNSQGRYLTQVVEGETAFNWGVEGEFASLYGAEQKTDGNGNTYLEGSADITLSNPQYTDNMIDVIRELHCSALGWISGYNPSDPIVQVQAARMQKEFGYRFHITEFSCDARTDLGANLNLQFKVKNKGSAPMYENWPLAVTLIDKNTRQLIWKATIPNVDIRNWHPGHDYSDTTRTYLTPAQEYLISASIPLPANLPAGEHLIGLSVLEPLSRTPGLFFAIPNFFKQSQTQPLAKIGIGMDATGHTLDGVAFDDPVMEDTRSYTMTQQGPNYTLNLEPSNLGKITRVSPSENYAKDTGVEVRAIGKLGYRFGSWGGALANTTANPAIVVMDSNKSISANYVPVATHLLNTTSANGSIILSPPGGIYNLGTEVTVTTTPSTGYIFSSWSGDLSGSASSTTIIMSGDKNLSADFTVPPMPGPVSFGVNCGGSSSYAAGDGVVFAADGVWNSGGSAFNVGSRSISNTIDDSLHLSHRWGSEFDYQIPVSNGDYEVALIFSEIYFDTAGARIFNVALEGVQVIANLDVFSVVGKDAAHHESRMVTVTDGQLDIAFSGVVNNANISAIKITRTQRPNSFTLVSNAANGTILSDPPAKVHDAGSVVSVMATPSSGYKFHSWSGDLSGTANPATVTMNANQSVTANFSPLTTYHSLATNSTNGSILPEPFGGIYYEGTPVALTAIPNAGYRFDSWGGDISGTTHPATVMMTSDRNVIANFSQIPTYTLVTGATHGSVSSVPSGGVHPEGTLVTLTAIPDTGYRFDSWSGDVSGVSGSEAVIMDENKSVTAVFMPIVRNSTIDTTGGTTVLDYGTPQNIYLGNGILKISNDGSGVISLGSDGGTTPTVFSMSGGLITIDSGVTFVNGGWMKGVWTNNRSDLQVNGTLDVTDGNPVIVNALNGSGAIALGWVWASRATELQVGILGGGGNFSGDIQEAHWAGSFVRIVKQGPGTQVFSNFERQKPGEIVINEGTVNLSTAVATIFSGSISGAGNLTKAGSGILTLNGALTYTGDTTVMDGILSVSLPAFADTSSVSIGVAAESPASIHLSNPGTDIIDQLIIDGVSQPGNGAVYDSSNSGDAITGPGKFQVGTAPTGYAAWRLIHGVVGSAGDDDDNDGLTNFEEYAFGLLPRNSSSSNPISTPLSIPSGTFSYTRRNSSLTPPLTYTVWYSAALDAGSWIEDGGAVHGQPVTNGDVETVQVTISPSLVMNPKLFIRVRAE